MPLNPIDWHKRFAQQAEWTSNTRRFLFNLAGIPDAESVLDVGSGTGVLTGEIANMGINLPVGIDIRFQFAEQAVEYAPKSQFTISDAHHLPFKNQTFDASFCHYVLMWVADPSSVLKQMIRVTKSGSAVLALAEPDYGGRIDHPSGLEIINEWQTKSLRQQGADPHCGRKLKRLFHQAGLLNITVGVIGAQWQESPTADEIDSEWDIIQHDLGCLENETSEHMNSSEEIKNIDVKSWKAGERILYVPTFYAIGQVPDN